MNLPEVAIPYFPRYHEEDAMERDLTLQIPADAALSLASTDPGGLLRFAAAVKLYEVGRLSAGAAARLAGVAKPVFLSRLGEWGVPVFRQTSDELMEELRNA